MDLEQEGTDGKKRKSCEELIKVYREEETHHILDAQESCIAWRTVEKLTMIPRPGALSKLLCMFTIPLLLSFLQDLVVVFEALQSLKQQNRCSHKIFQFLRPRQLS